MYNIAMINLSSIQKKYKGMWVALTDDFNSVITANKDAKTTYKKALEKSKIYLQR